ncbi:MAG: 2-phospho-L-lactate guanylyltransferase [Anaerolineales bacterium]|jgi:2-phospho-L-lactate guanylyltransferase
MTIWAIVPVKPLRHGKSRLAGVLTEDQRTRLNRRLLEHTLTELSEIPEISSTLVISRDPAALSVARNLGARTLLEDHAPQLNTALNRAMAVAGAHAAHAILILPADLPLVESKDIRILINLGKNPPVVVIAPDRKKDGTNGLFISPVGLLDFSFGPGSFNRHCERARLAGATLKIANSPGLELDLDLPEDLEKLGGLDELKLP